MKWHISRITTSNVEYLVRYENTSNCHNAIWCEPTLHNKEHHTCEFDHLSDAKAQRDEIKSFEREIYGGTSHELNKASYQVRPTIF
ncbi:MAG: hypothetical protein WC796_02195 [Candidatus Pacearchaeota archaeon]|jgi:hypothetical protein